MLYSNTSVMCVQNEMCVKTLLKIGQYVAIVCSQINPFKFEFVTVIFMYYKNCCRNSRLTVDEDDTKWVTNEKKYCDYIRNSIKMFILKPQGIRN